MLTREWPHTHQVSHPMCDVICSALLSDWLVMVYNLICKSAYRLENNIKTKRELRLKKPWISFDGDLPNKNELKFKLLVLSLSIVKFWCILIYSSIHVTYFQFQEMYYNHNQIHTHTMRNEWWFKLSRYGEEMNLNCYMIQNLLSDVSHSYQKKILIYIFWNFLIRQKNYFLLFGIRYEVCSFWKLAFMA